MGWVGAIARFPKIGDGIFLSSFSCSLVVEQLTRLGSIHFKY